MENTAQKLEKILEAKASIKTAIEGMGVPDVGDDLSAYPDKIRSIGTGGGVGRDFRIMIMQANDMSDGTNGLSETAMPEYFIPVSDTVPEGTEFFLWRMTRKSRKMDRSVLWNGGTMYKRPHYAPVFAEPLDTSLKGPENYRSNPVKVVAQSIGIEGQGGDATGVSQIKINAGGRGLRLLVMKDDYSFRDFLEKTEKGISLGRFIAKRYIRGYSSNEFSSLVNNSPQFTGCGCYLYPLQEDIYKKKERFFAISTTLENPVLIPFRVYMIVKPTIVSNREKIHTGVVSMNADDTIQVVIRAEAL